MAELKAGGLAIVISSEFPENVGKVVTTLSYSGTQLCLTPQGVKRLDNSWIVSSNKSLNTSIGWVDAGTEVCIQAKKLLPIDGDNLELTEEEKKELQIA